MNTQQSKPFFGKKNFFIASIAASIVISVPTFTGCQNQETANLSLKPAISATQVTNAGTIVDVASANSSLKTLVTTLKRADLVEMLSGKDQFTLFAPTDAAFTSSLPKGTLEKLFKPEKKATLRKILTYHIIPGAIDSKPFKSDRVKTVEGSSVYINFNNGLVTVDIAKVTPGEIKASNGVIYIIDKVILPPGVKP